MTRPSYGTFQISRWLIRLFSALMIVAFATVAVGCSIIFANLLPGALA